MTPATGWWHAWAALGVCLALAGAVLIWHWISIQSHADRTAAFQADGVTVPAEVRRKSINTGPYAKDATRHDVVVRYTDRDGRTFLAQTHVGRPYFDRVTAGDRVPLTYLPGPPRTWMLDPAHGAPDGRLAWIIAVLLTGCGIYNFWSIRHRQSHAGQIEQATRTRRRAEIAAFRARRGPDRSD